MRISPREEALLIWWFGQVAFERSTCGAMLERAELFVTAARQYIEQRNIELAPQRMRRRSHEPWDVAPLTAVPMHETRAPAGYVPNDDDLTRAAVVGRRLRLMSSEGHAEAIAVLGLYYGSVGAHFEDREPDEGPLPRLFALMHVTTAGQKLLDRAAKFASGAGLDLPPYARMRVHCMMRERTMYTPLQELFARGELECEALYRGACAAWAGARPDERTISTGRTAALEHA